MKPVAAFQLKAAVGNKHLVVPLHSAHQHLDLHLFVKVHKLAAVQKAVLLQLNLHNFHPALGKGVPPEEGGVLKQPENLAGSGQLGVDHHRQAQLVLPVVELRVVLGVAHPGDGVGAAQLVGGDTAQQVGFISRGGGNQQVAAADIGLILGFDGCAVAVHHADVQRLLGLLQHQAVAVNHHHVMAFLCQLDGQGPSHLAVAHDYNFHVRYLPKSKRMKNHPLYYHNPLQTSSPQRNPVPKSRGAALAKLTHRQSPCRREELGLRLQFLTPVGRRLYRTYAT